MFRFIKKCFTSCWHGITSCFGRCFQRRRRHQNYIADEITATDLDSFSDDGDSIDLPLPFPCTNAREVFTVENMLARRLNFYKFSSLKFRKEFISFGYVEELSESDTQEPIKPSKLVRDPPPCWKIHISIDFTSEDFSNFTKAWERCLLPLLTELDQQERPKYPFTFIKIIDPRHPRGPASAHKIITIYERDNILSNEKLNAFLQKVSDSFKREKIKIAPITKVYREIKTESGESTGISYRHEARKKEDETKYIYLNEESITKLYPEEKEYWWNLNRLPCPYDCLVIRDYQPQEESSSETETSSLFETPSSFFQKIKTSLIGILPNGEQINLSEDQVLGDGDCGFTTIGATRDQMANCLTNLSTNPEIRDQLSEEILEAIMGERFNQEDEEWKTLVAERDTAQTNWSRFFRKMRKLSSDWQPLPNQNQEEQTRELIHELNTRGFQEEAIQLNNYWLILSQAETDLMQYARSEEIFLTYIEALRTKGIWLGYQSALLYAQQQEMSLYIWRRSSSELNTLELIAYHQAERPNGQVIHMLHTNEFIHFNLLTISQEASIEESINLENGQLENSVDFNSTASSQY